MITNNNADTVIRVANSNMDEDVKKDILYAIANDSNGETWGILDKLFGTKNSDKYLVVFLCSIFVIILGVVYLINKNDVSEFGKIISPIFTLAMGYIAGKNTKS